MIEQYSAAGEVRGVILGLISAITAVNLKQDESSKPEVQHEYEVGGKKMLDHLANEESLIHQISPLTSKRTRETLQKARASYPEPESKEHLLILLNDYGMLNRF